MSTFTALRTKILVIFQIFVATIKVFVTQLLLHAYLVDADVINF